MDDKAPDGADVLARFKAGVAAQVSPFDAATHFDLAMAYAEMGMVQDAIDELAIVLQANPRHVRARAALVELRLRLAAPGGEPPDDVA
jgi:hypothetical protein